MEGAPSGDGERGSGEEGRGDGGRGEGSSGEGGSGDEVESDGEASSLRVQRSHDLLCPARTVYIPQRQRLAWEESVCYSPSTQPGEGVRV